MIWAVRIFAGLYVLALALLAIGTFGWLGQDPDPLSGVFLLPLGLPWNLLADRLGISGTMAMIIAPAINLALLIGLQRRRSR